MTDDTYIKKTSFQMDFDSYIRETEPSKKVKGENWAVAIGLQQVDGLTPSAYLYETAKRNIDGEITISEAKKLIDTYYESRTVRTEESAETEEADKVSARIAEILSEQAFSFSPLQLISIHERLFKGVFVNVKAGKFRDYNITKKEWALDGDTVLYANAGLIRETLQYDFDIEKKFDYTGLSQEDIVKHITRFIANIWQIHPFGEGNTRTTAVFTIKYLQSLGFAVNNEPFEENSWYFRNALVRANYVNVKKDITMNTEYLECFFRNILLGGQNELKNRYTHLRYTKELEQAILAGKHSANDNVTTSNDNVNAESDNVNVVNDNVNDNVNAENDNVNVVNDNVNVVNDNVNAVNDNVNAANDNVTTSNDNVNDNVNAENDNVNLTDNQKLILDEISNNPYITQEALAAAVRITVVNINRNMRKLRELGIIRRIGADRNGYWEIIKHN